MATPGLRAHRVKLTLLLLLRLLPPPPLSFPAPLRRALLRRCTRRSPHLWARRSSHRGITIEDVEVAAKVEVVEEVEEEVVVDRVERLVLLRL